MNLRKNWYWVLILVGFLMLWFGLFVRGVSGQEPCVTRVYPLPPWLDPNAVDPNVIVLPLDVSNPDDPNWGHVLGKTNREYAPACHPLGHQFTIRVIRATAPTTIHHDIANERWSFATDTVPYKNEVTVEAETVFGGRQLYMVAWWGGDPNDPDWKPLAPILY